MNRTALIRELIGEEDEVLHAYADSRGYLTIGVGRLIDARKGGGISQEESRYLLNNDIDSKLHDLLTRAPVFTALDDVRQRALCNMCFQLGIDGLLKFKKMWAALVAGDWQAAHDEALDSAWARQTPARAERVAQMLLTGEAA